MFYYPADIDARVQLVKVQIEKLSAQMTMRDENKCVSLGTSKVNYIDPRIVASWAHRENVPITRIFNKSLLKKFPWALGEQNYNF